MTHALAVDSLRKTYGGRDVVSDLSFTAPQAAITAVLGPNGAGKTTTIECCENLRRPDGGSIEVLGREPADPTLRYDVGVMLQDGGLPTGVRAVEMLTHVAAMYPNPWPIADLVERLGLGSFARTTVRRLSGGQRQRLALAAAVVGRPRLVFLDEPSAGMDPQSRQAVWDLVRSGRDEGVSFVLTTHLMDEAAALADKVVIVDHGTVIASGSVAELTGADSTSDGSASSTLRWRSDAGLPIAQLIAQWEPDPSTGDTWSCEELRPGEYVATGRVSPESLTTLTRWCEGHAALVTQLTVNQRSLEDVFLDLTGRHLR